MTSLADPALLFGVIPGDAQFCRVRTACGRPATPKPAPISIGEALHLGLLPCDECEPMARPKEPAWLGQLVVQVLRSPAQGVPEETLRATGIDPDRVRALFKRSFGVTFAGFQRAVRLGSAMRPLFVRTDAPLMPAFRCLFGAPGRGKERLCVSTAETALGRMIGIASQHELLLCEFLDRRALASELVYIFQRLNAYAEPESNVHLTAWKGELKEYFAGKRSVFEVPLARLGSEFQRHVWDELVKIPYGETASYGELAARLGRSGAARAIGRANGQNRIGILVPCHRVIGADGALVGYGGKLWRKKRLLEHEGALPTSHTEV